ncbi:MAG TPA: hypothetical protein VHQ90_07730 [Thermoanaerobaculia bacterium]|nr:hypothetical protein [Thermoanaerobaculia bacterium]
MKKLKTKKLTLSRESLQQLEQPSLRQVDGAGRTFGECTIGGLTHCLNCP